MKTWTKEGTNSEGTCDKIPPGITGISPSPLTDCYSVAVQAKGRVLELMESIYPLNSRCHFAKRLSLFRVIGIIRKDNAPI